MSYTGPSPKLNFQIHDFSRSVKHELHKKISFSAFHEVKIDYFLKNRELIHLKASGRKFPIRLSFHFYFLH